MQPHQNVFRRQSWLAMLILQLCSNPKEKDRLQRKYISIWFCLPLRIFLPILSSTGPNVTFCRFGPWVDINSALILMEKRHYRWKRRVEWYEKRDCSGNEKPWYLYVKSSAGIVSNAMKASTSKTLVCAPLAFWRLTAPAVNWSENVENSEQSSRL